MPSQPSSTMVDLSDRTAAASSPASTQTTAVPGSERRITECSWKKVVIPNEKPAPRRFVHFRCNFYLFSRRLLIA